MMITSIRTDRKAHLPPPLTRQMEVIESVPGRDLMPIPTIRPLDVLVHGVPQPVNMHPARLAAAAAALLVDL